METVLSDEIEFMDTIQGLGHIFTRVFTATSGNPGGRYFPLIVLSHSPTYPQLTAGYPPILRSKSETRHEPTGRYSIKATWHPAILTPAFLQILGITGLVHGTFPRPKAFAHQGLRAGRRMLL